MIIRFVQGTNLNSKLIVMQSKTAMPFTPSHVEALTPDGFLLGAHFASGVQKRKPGYDNAHTAHELFIELDATADQNKLFYEFLESKIGEPYDWRAIFGFLLPAHEHTMNHAICSALITLALRQCRWFQFVLASPAHLISPRDLLLMVSSRMLVPMG